MLEQTEKQTPTHHPPKDYRIVVPSLTNVHLLINTYIDIPIINTIPIGCVQVDIDSKLTMCVNVYDICICKYTSQEL